MVQGDVITSFISREDLVTLVFTSSDGVKPDSVSSGVEREDTLLIVSTTPHTFSMIIEVTADISPYSGVTAYLLTDCVV